MKKLSIEDKQKIAQVAECINDTKKLIDAFIPQMNGLSIGKMITTNDELHDILSDPKRGVSNIIKARMPETEYGGIPVDKEARYRLLILPDLSELTEMALAIRSSAQGYALNYLSGLFELDGDRVKVNQEKKEKELDRHRTYAESNDEVKFLDLQKEFVNAYNKMREHAGTMVGPDNVKERFTPGTFEMSKFIKSDFTISPQAFDEIKRYQNMLKVSRA